VALDVAQEVFARAYQYRRMLAGLDRPAAWVHRVATNEAPSSLRKRRVRSRPHPVQLTALSPEPVTPDDELLAAVRSLAPAQRAAIVLRYYLDMSVEDAAAALGKRPGTVRALTSQALAPTRWMRPGFESDWPPGRDGSTWTTLRSIRSSGWGGGGQGGRESGWLRAWPPLSWWPRR
jgi:RNA polymerase sigma factor (sigma-70 family)